MANDYYLLSASDVRVIQEVVDKARRLLANTALRGAGRGDEHQAPEFYICRAPAWGISAFVGSGELLSYEDCDVYRISDAPGTTPTLEQVAGFTLKVYNLSKDEVHGFFTASRDKFGRWLAVAPGELGFPIDTGTGTGTFLDLFTGTGTTAACEIPGLSMADLAVESNPDYVLGVKGSCVVKVPVGSC